MPTLQHAALCNTWKQLLVFAFFLCNNSTCLALRKVLASVMTGENAAVANLRHHKSKKFSCGSTCVNGPFAMAKIIIELDTQSSIFHKTASFQSSHSSVYHVFSVYVKIVNVFVVHFLLNCQERFF